MAGSVHDRRRGRAGFSQRVPPSSTPTTTVLTRSRTSTGWASTTLAELRAADRLIGDLVEVLPRGACLVVTSDHGQVDVGRSAELPANDLLEASWLISGEGRFRWFHARPGAARDLEAAAVEHHGQCAWVRTLEQIQDEGGSGGRLRKQVASRLGDVALVARDPIAFLDPADPGETRLAARHGSLTPPRCTFLFSPSRSDDPAE